MTVMSLQIVKMTNREVDGEQAYDSRLAALLAVHLVSQILDEAYAIVNGPSQTDQEDSMVYQSMLRNLDSDKQCDADDEDTSFEASRGDSDIVNENKIELEQHAHVVATSTPAKVTDNSHSGDLTKNMPEAGLIGQGDEELDLRQNELTKSTSMFINHLFNMSDVERVLICEDTEIDQSYNEESDELLTQAMAKIMESYVNAAMGVTFEEPSQSVAGGMPSSSPEQSDYSFLTDAFVEDISKDVSFYLRDDGAGDVDRNCGASHLVPTVQIRELCDEIPEKLVENDDVARYENAYLTLNRDYDQCSEDEVEPILEDPKGMTLQEVELMTANTSEENLRTQHEPEPNICPKMKELAATSGVSATASGSRKSSLASRCRSQGARLLACLRGWWRRRTPGRRKENRLPCPPPGLCPLSPDARRRATSLLDQRLLYSPTPTHGVVWKFNTVNEALVHSARWKDYTFDVKPDEHREF